MNTSNGDETHASTSTAQPSEPSKEVILHPEGIPMLVPRLIHHPRLVEWSPPDHINKYLTYWLRRLLDKEVHNRLRTECPRPIVSPKVTNTPDFDTFMSNYMLQQGRDPCKGIEKGLKSAQDKLLDVAGPLTQTLVLTDEAISQGSPLDPLIMWDWLQRFICPLGNATTSLSSKHRRTALLRFNPELTDMADKES